MEANQSTSLPKLADNVLNDLRYYLAIIEAVVYQKPLELLSGSTIGQHTRHIIEFYSCLLEQSNPGSDSIINYAKRRRDYRTESDPNYAFEILQIISHKLDDLDVSQICKLDCEEHGHANLLIESTIGRELIYNIEHTIHHLAIVKMALQHAMPALDLPAHFGVAPSTIRHRHEACVR